MWGIISQSTHMDARQFTDMKDALFEVFKGMSDDEIADLININCFDGYEYTSDVELPLTGFQTAGDLEVANARYCGTLPNSTYNFDRLLEMLAMKLADITEDTIADNDFADFGKDYRIIEIK